MSRSGTRCSGRGGCSAWSIEIQMTDAGMQTDRRSGRRMQGCRQTDRQPVVCHLSDCLSVFCHASVRPREKSPERRKDLVVSVTGDLSSCKMCSAWCSARTQAQTDRQTDRQTDTLKTFTGSIGRMCTTAVALHHVHHCTAHKLCTNSLIFV